jgi:Mg2+-importing ATPase
VSRKKASKTEQIRVLERRQMEREILLSSILTDDQLYMAYDTTAEGFSAERAEEVLDEKGENIIEQSKEQPVALRLLLSFTSPFSLVLLLVAAVSFLTETLYGGDRSYATLTIILSLVLISGLVQFFQEFRSDRAASKLKEMVSSNASALRDGKMQEIPMSEIVPGDIVALSAGDMLPADLRILTAKDLFIGQAALTGESEPVEKFQSIKAPPKSALEAANMGFMGTNVVSGSARAIVIATGSKTYLGLLARELTGKKAQTSFEKGIADVSSLLLRLMVVMVPVIFLVNGLTKKDWVSSLLFALSVAVGITPELLPMIMTSTLAKGALSMAKRKTIVKNLSSIQSFGAMDILCTDKTGTLTEDKIILERYLDVHGNDDRAVLKHAFLNSYFQTGMKNMMDLAIIERARKENHMDWFRTYRKLDEIPFDFNRRRMSVVLEDDCGKRQLITKGAVEEMLNICNYALYQGEAHAITDSLRNEALELSGRLNEGGLRVIAVAQKNEVSDVGVFSPADETEMVLMGFVAFLDPPKDSAKQAIAALKGHGVRVAVLTGDNEKVAISVCGKVGLEADEVLLGADIETISDDELKVLTERVNLYAKLSPAQKARVVRLMQENGHVIGYMGDGINDAPALHQSDVGISVDSAVDIAKESAHIILLEKSLMVLEEGVVEGRRTFGNIVKYIKMACSGNFGNMFSILAASVFLPFLPMLPIQILTQNLLYDFSQIAIPLDRMDEEYLRKPQKWNAKGIARFMYHLGPVSSLFDILAFLTLYFVFRYNGTDFSQSYFQTGWFIMGLLSQTLIVHLIRSAKVPFIESRAALPLLVSTIGVSLAGLAIPYTIIGDALDMAPISGLYIPCVLGLLMLYAIAVQMIKVYYIRRYNEWI